jgi:hypothetical protein
MPSEQWQEVNIAATKRYIGSLKRLSGKVSARSGGGCMAHKRGSQLASLTSMSATSSAALWLQTCDLWACRTATSAR